jgi:hypothetical protein
LNDRAIVLAVLSPFLVGCAQDRSDPRAVSEAAFGAIMGKDYEQLCQLTAERNGPDDEEWAIAAFMRNYTSGEKIKGLWRQGPILGVALGEPEFEDSQGPRNSPAKPYQYQFRVPPSLSGRVVQIPFVVSDQSYVATFPHDVPRPPMVSGYESPNR